MVRVVDGAGLATCVDETVVVIGSLHPNHPGVSQVVVVVVLVDVVVVLAVVVLSRQPHHPGVSHVVVRVLVAVEELEEDVVLSVPLLS